MDEIKDGAIQFEDKENGVKYVYRTSHDENRSMFLDEYNICADNEYLWKVLEDNELVRITND